MNIIRFIFMLALGSFVFGILPPANAGERDITKRRDPIAEHWRNIEGIAEALLAGLQYDEAKSTILIENVCLLAALSDLPKPQVCPSTDKNNVFATSNEFTGFLFGVPGANVKCNALAMQAGLNGTYKAWLSGDDSQPVDTFIHSSLPYILPDGVTIVAENWDDLTDGTLDHQINQDENGIAIFSGGSSVDPKFTVWTNTATDGTCNSGPCIGNSQFPCDNWFSAAGFGTAGASIGSVFLSDENWTFLNFNQSCSIPRKLYCFEQVPEPR